jgi:hypothetical protein
VRVKRLLLATVTLLTLAGAAVAAPNVDVPVLPKPPFPLPVSKVGPSDRHRLRGNTLHVRTYDHVVVAKTSGP